MDSAALVLPWGQEHVLFRTGAAAEACVLKWQRILRLQDWRFDVAIVDRETNDGCNAMACINRQNKRVLIRLTSHYDRMDDGGWPEWSEDMEEDLLHELMHVLLDDMVQAKGQARRGAEETACNLVADALLRLDRAGR